MQLISDAITVLGSRHGLILSPHSRSAQLLKFDRFDEAPTVEIHAGVRIGQRTLVFPLCKGGDLFRFLDQRITPCKSTFIGIDPDSRLKVTLEIVTPFRPRDPEFSTTPVIGIRLRSERIAGQFRWEKLQVEPKGPAELFMELSSPVLQQRSVGDSTLELNYQTNIRPCIPWSARPGPAGLQAVEQTDRIVVKSGLLRDGRFSIQIDPANDQQPTLELGWCSWSNPVLEVQGYKAPFRYTKNFQNIDEVVDWTKGHSSALFENADRVDGIIASAEVGAANHHLLAQTLHSWLACTWWVQARDREWFSVWEGNCYFHSTVDVEFTQAPFYLSVWPELLGMELESWPLFSKPGELVLGSQGEGTAFLSHDCGSYAGANAQSYPHDMAVEETANYLIMVFAYIRRTAERELAIRQAATIERYLRFLIACDTRGNGVPDKGVANTIDDGSPAIQFGKQQTYLAVKTLAALLVGVELLALFKNTLLAAKCEAQAQKLRSTFNRFSWQGDHFAVLLEKSGTLEDPWTGKLLHWDEIPGWDAAHIYTANTLPILDMVGFDLGIDSKKVREDIQTGARRCLREYGCIHTDFDRGTSQDAAGPGELTGASRNPGWISMNITRDLAAFYRKLDFRHMAERYWDWQLVTNSRETCLFFETFGGNNLHFYPRGVALWGIFDAIAGVSIDRTAAIISVGPSLKDVRVPLLHTADWSTGKVEIIYASD